MDLIYPLKMVIFHSYVSLPEGNTLRLMLDSQRVQSNSGGSAGRGLRHAWCTAEPGREKGESLWGVVTNLNGHGETPT